MKLCTHKTRSCVARAGSLIFAVSMSCQGVVRADIDGIPYNSEFPKAQYPYAQAPDGCSGWNDPKEVRDTWGPVSFKDACNQHDKCYYTVGSKWNTCNERYYSDLRTACERDLRTAVRNPITGKKYYLPPDPVRLSTCYGIATTYYSGVQVGVALDVFKDAQRKQKKYDEWVASVRAGASRASSAPVFDPDFYLMTYGDLRNAFGTDQGAARNHWLTYGIKEGRRSSPAFVVRYYLSLYPDLRNVFSNDFSAAINHWLTYGINEGRRSSLVFDVQYYLNRYSDLKNAFGSDNYSAAVQHWLSYGVREGRQGSPDFDPKYYLSANPDVARVYGSNNYKGAIEHYLEYGRAERRRGSAP